MTDQDLNGKAKRDRSPSFPFIGLETAIPRVAAFEKYFGRHSAPVDKAGLAWGMKGGTSQALQTIAALKAFGFLESQRTANGTQLVLTDDARTYLRAQQESVKQEIVRRAALQPRQIANYWNTWGADRPPDPVCLDELVLRGNFSQDGADKFLKVYDNTIAYAGLADSDKVPSELGDEAMPLADEEPQRRSPSPPRQPIPPAQGGIPIMEGERELTTGLLSKDTSFRLIVSGHIGVKEIERLIKKLEFDKEILADEDAPSVEPDADA